MKVSELEQLVGGLSRPSKMPGFAYGIPAAECIVGSILRKRAGSVCSKCYAHKGMYVFPNVRKAQARRLEILRSDLDGWTRNMIALLRKKYAKRTGADRVFRWHDSGDIQSAAHLSAIVKIARELSDIRFWMPTKERAAVRKWLSNNPSGFPRNLVVRLSAPMIGDTLKPLEGVRGSTVGAGKGYACPAYSQGGQCGDCRECWNFSRKSIDYPLH